MRFNRFPNECPKAPINRPNTWLEELHLEAAFRLEEMDFLPVQALQHGLKTGQSGNRAPA
jgi:hypothetical protein